MKAEQKTALLAAMDITDPAMAITPADVPYDVRIATLHLMTSMAEYQLC